MSDQVRFGADATEYFDVIAQMQQRLEQLGGTINQFGSSGVGGGRAFDEWGEGAVRSERIVSRSIGNMVRDLGTARSAADVLADAFLSVERAGKLGFGLAIGVGVGVAAYEAVSKEIEKIKKVDEDLARQMSQPITQEIKLDTAGLDKDISGLTTALDAKIKESATFATALINTYKGIFQNLTETDPQKFRDQTPGSFFGSKGTDADTAAIEAAEKRLEELGRARGQNELAVAEAKRVSAHVSEDEGAILKINAEYTAKEAAAILLARSEIDKGGSAVGVTDRIKGLREEHDLAIESEKAKDALLQSQLAGEKEIADFRGSAGEREEKILAVHLAQAEAVKASALAHGNIEQQERAEVEVAKALEAIDQHRLALAIQQSQLHFSQEENKVREDTSRQAVGAGPEQTGRLAADEAVHLAALKLASVKDEIRIEQELLQTKEVSYQLTKAEGDAQATLNVAINKRAEFELKTYQARQLALAAAQGETVILADKEAHDQRAEGLAQIQLKYQQEIAKARQEQIQPAIIEELEKQAELSAKIFAEDFDFKRQQQLEAAKAQTTELQLQAQGQSELGRFVRDRIDAELKIVAAIREQNGALADQIRAQEEARIIAGLASDLRKTPKQQEAAQVEQQAQQDAAYRAAALIKDINDRIARGAYGQTPDAATEAAAAIRNLGESAKKEADAKPSLPDWTQLKPHLPDWSHLLPRGLPAGEPPAPQPPIAPSSSTSVPGEQPAPPSQAPAAQQNPIVEAVKARQAEENRPRDSHFADLQEHPEPFLPNEPLPQPSPPASEPKPTPGPLPPAPDWTSIKPDLPQWSDLQPKVPDWSSLKPTGATGSPGEGTSAPQQTPASAPTATPAAQPEPVKPAPIDLSGLKNLFSGLDLGKPAPAPFLPSDVGPPGVAGGQKPDFSNAQNLLNNLNPEAQPQLPPTPQPPPAAQPSAPPAPDWNAVKPELPEWTQLKPELPDWSKLKPTGETSPAPTPGSPTPATTTPALSEPSASPSQRPAPSETPAPRETSPTTVPSAPPPAQPSAPPAPDWSALKPELPEWTQLKPEVPDWSNLKPNLPGEVPAGGESPPPASPSAPPPPSNATSGLGAWSDDLLSHFSDLSSASQDLAEKVKSEADATNNATAGASNLGGAGSAAAGAVNTLTTPAKQSADKLEALHPSAKDAAQAIDQLGTSAKNTANNLGGGGGPTKGPSGENAPGGQAPTGADPNSGQFTDRHRDISGDVQSAVDKRTGQRVTFNTPSELDKPIGGELDKPIGGELDKPIGGELDKPPFKPRPSGPFSNDQGVGDQPPGPSKPPESPPADKPPQVPDWTDQKPKGLPDWASEKPKGLPDWSDQKPKGLPDWSDLKPRGLPDFSNLNFSSLIGLASANFSSLIAVGQMNFSGLSSLNGLTITIQ